MTDTKAALLAEAQAHKWFHRIPLYDDYTTPGIDNTLEKLEHLDALGLPADLTGKRVLDIGAWDGAFSFECERRGATVMALDHVDSTATGFHIASRALNSKVEWTVQNLYHMSPDQIGTFDIVLCLGVIYHLRHILLGMDRVRAVMGPDALLFIETAAIDNHAQLNSGKFGSFTDACPDAHATPLLQMYPKGELNGDRTNVFAPNAAGLEALLTASEFALIAQKTWPRHRPTRAIASARAVNDPTIAFYRDRDEAVLQTRAYFKK